MNNVITCLSDSYSVSRRETYESIVNYISYFKQLESRLQQLQNHLYGWYFKSLVTVVPQDKHLIGVILELLKLKKCPV